MGTQSILIRNDKVPREGVRKICKVGEFELNFQKPGFNPNKTSFKKNHASETHLKRTKKVESVCV